jgi:hypothetical protein
VEKFKDLERGELFDGIQDCNLIPVKK